VGAVSQSQGSRQVTHLDLAEPQGLDSRLHSHQRRQDARGQCAGHLGLGARGVLFDGPRLRLLCSPFPNASGRRFLCNPRQKQHEQQARVLGQSGQDERHHQRSIHCTERARYLPRLPRTPAAYPLQRSRNPTDFSLLDLQHKIAALDHRCVVQKPLAGEIVFKWIKQHLRIKKFLGNSENAVKTQIWCAVSTYELIAIVKKELQLYASLYTLVQILSVSVFEKTEVSSALQLDRNSFDNADNDNQLNLFNF